LLCGSVPIIGAVSQCRGPRSRTRHGRLGRIVASLCAVRRRGPVELSYLALVALAACLAPNATLEFSTALRNTAFLVVLLPLVVAAPRLLPRTTSLVECGAG
jgi:hypothetical protein